MAGDSLALVAALPTGLAKAVALIAAEERRAAVAVRTPAAQVVSAPLPFS